MRVFVHPADRRRRPRLALRRLAARRTAAAALALAAFTAQAPRASALPIGFGINQGPLEYREVKSDNFIVYHDARAASEGVATLNALEAARPLYELWFKQKRSSPLPIVMSAVTDNASFADFITDAIELQTLGHGDKSLAWHEYTHSTMYRAFDNLLGPAGSILNLPWMPAWFLEGLAEAVSVSAGSDVTAGIERYQALSGDWPTYPRLHSLYSAASFFERGYATSGAMVSYLLRKGGPNKLPALLEDFRAYSMPWWWPWTVVPFNGFLPMDAALENYVKLNGEDFYTDYKKSAAEHWKKVATGPLTVKDGAPKKGYAAIPCIIERDGELRAIVREDDDRLEVGLTFDAKTGWLTKTTTRAKIPDGTAACIGLTGPLSAQVKYESEHTGDTSDVKLRDKAGRLIMKLKRDAIVTGLWEMPNEVAFSEFAPGGSRICLIDKKKRGAPRCLFDAKTPREAFSLGNRVDAKGMTRELWLATSEERLTGTQYHVHIYDAQKRALRRNVMTLPVRPLALAFSGGDPYLLTAERTHRVIRHYDAALTCKGMITPEDHVERLYGQNDALVVGLYGGASRYVRRWPRATLKESACAAPEPTTSPVIAALVRGGTPDMATAMADASLWRGASAKDDAAVTKSVAAKSDLDKEVPTGVHADTEPKPTQFRPHSLFLFPWIGADDALGYQLGAVSVPLVDQLQNETVRATFLYGANSHFPYQEISLTSTRYTPTITLTAYREQTYNGRFLNRETGGTVTSFLDEKGARLEQLTPFHLLGSAGQFGAGVKYAHLAPYIGPTRNARGFLLEPAATVSLVTPVTPSLGLTNTLSGRVAPGDLNDNFDYNQVGASSSLGFPLPLDSHASLGVEGSRTRGKKRRDLKEEYRPLKTFIPGSGGGYNQNSFPLGAEGTGLFSPRYGDTQARAKANFTIPVVHDVDRLLWIIYFERIDFSAFYNYGGAWNGDKPYFGYDKLVGAHGYDLDLQMENKGVRFNLGLGTGAVVGEKLEFYVTTGFDALF